MDLCHWRTQQRLPAAAAVAAAGAQFHAKLVPAGPLSAAAAAAAAARGRAAPANAAFPVDKPIAIARFIPSTAEGITASAVGCGCAAARLRHAARGSCTVCARDARATHCALLRRQRRRCGRSERCAGRLRASGYALLLLVARASAPALPAAVLRISDGRRCGGLQPQQAPAAAVASNWLAGGLSRELSRMVKLAAAAARLGISLAEPAGRSGCHRGAAAAAAAALTAARGGTHTRAHTHATRTAFAVSKR